MEITTNTTNLSADQIIAHVNAHNELFASIFGIPENQHFTQDDDGHLVETSSIYASVIISNGAN